MIRKLKSDIEKLKREKEEALKQKQAQDSRLTSMEQSILDLNALVERCQREIDKNTVKRDKLK